MRILVVDDDPDLLKCLAESLRMDGHLVAQATSAEDALPMLPHVDACIVDGLGGRGIRVLEQAYPKPAVLFTGDDVLAFEAEQEGIPTILKPAGTAQILAALEFQAVASR